ncbi:hypothetical protein AB1Y20_000503 [Prymnesium parvum]|uniref:Uncharacterized protein n=1 Tax=Prymnesium parvum TaxID=97485 RepID=A0AB34K524_PRYPA
MDYSLQKQISHITLHHPDKEIYLSRQRHEQGEQRSYLVAPINATPQQINALAQSGEWYSLEEVSALMGASPPRKANIAVDLGRVKYKGKACTVYRDTAGKLVLLREGESLSARLSKKERFTEAEIRRLPKEPSMNAVGEGLTIAMGNDSVLEDKLLLEERARLEAGMNPTMLLLARHAQISIQLSAKLITLSAKREHLTTRAVVMEDAENVRNVVKEEGEKARAQLEQLISGLAEAMGKGEARSGQEAVRQEGEATRAQLRLKHDALEVAMMELRGETSLGIASILREMKAQKAPRPVQKSRKAELEAKFDAQKRLHEEAIERHQAQMVELQARTGLTGLDGGAGGIAEALVCGAQDVIWSVGNELRRLNNQVATPISSGSSSSREGGLMTESSYQTFEEMELRTT